MNNLLNLKLSEIYDTITYRYNRVHFLSNL